MAENYMKDKTVRIYYDRWIETSLPDPGTPTPLGHPTDYYMFYAFVKACVQWAEHEDLRRKLDTSILRLHLYDDLHHRYTEEGYVLIRDKIIVLFEQLVDYEATGPPYYP